MLKTNSKKTIVKVRRWILCNAAEAGEYDNMPIPQNDEWTEEQFNELSAWILKTAESEKFYCHYPTRLDMFRDWAAGLPSALNTADYYYSHSARDVLGDILEETKAERERFTEKDALRVMDTLVFRELEKGERRFKTTAQRAE